MTSYKLHRLNGYNYEPNSINCLNYNEEIQKLAIARENASIEIWNFSEAPYVEKVLFSQSGNSIEDISWCGSRLFSTGLSGFVVEYDLQSLKEKQTVSLIGGPTWCLSANKQRTLLSAGTEEGYVCLIQVQDDTLSYVRKFDKQEGRILCVSWHCSGDSLATGSVDAIRIWNVETGHAITRIAVGRLKKSVETLLWSILYLRDYTVVSGDSCGRTSVWDGHTGTLLSSSRVHKGDVLCLCVNKDETCVYASGVDPLIVQFSKVNTKSNVSKENREIWVKSVQMVSHTHDVRSLAIVGKFIVSGGVDCHLTLTKGPPKTTYKYVPVNYHNNFMIAPTGRCVLLQYPKILEVWRLGKSNDNKEMDGDVLRLSINGTRALQLRCKDDEQIVCSAISNDARLLSYSTSQRINLYNFILEDDPVTQLPSASLNKIHIVPKGISSAQKMRFSSSGKFLLLSTENATIQVLEMNLIQPCLIHTFSPPGISSRINLLESSSDDTVFATSDHLGNVTIYDIEKKKVWASLPSYKYQATALAFSPYLMNLFVIYLDKKVIEYDVRSRCYANSCKNLKNLAKHFDPQYPVLSISFDLVNDFKVLFHDENTVYSYDDSIERQARDSPTSRKLVRTSSKVDNGSDISDSEVRLTKCKKFKHLLGFGSVSNGEMVALELTPEKIQLRLPAALKKKTFGT